MAHQTVSFDVEQVRCQFPALSLRVGDAPAVYFDGPAGSQVPRSVVDAVARYMTETNANHGGLFETGRKSDAILHNAHAALADFVGTPDPDCIAFGANMTTLTFALSRALARTWKPGDEILVTDLDHDANVTPWVLAARDAGATVHRIRVKPEDATLDLDAFQSTLSARTKLVAVGYASDSRDDCRCTPDRGPGLYRRRPLCTTWVDRRRRYRLRLSGLLGV
jgi:selenocysteine lyase/cysteine desulfurase